MEPVPPITQIAAVLTCPACGSSQIEVPPPLVPAINPHASSGSKQPLAANPDPHHRCVNCDSRWPESDLSGARFESLRASYREAQS
jgi:hypothetical protein